MKKAEEHIERRLREESEETYEEYFTGKQIDGWKVLNAYDPKIPPMNIGQMEHYY